MTGKAPRQPEVVPAMIGVAGHVSHGKSSLIQLMTGCRMNRLPEERERGLTIDLGFAPCTLPGDRLCGVIDVPGHRDFVRNMVAGASSIDVLLLVVAADDGVMPQTEEHMKIARLLGVSRMMAVITKTDLVDAEMLGLVRDEVTGFLARWGFPDADVTAVSNSTGEGLDDVREGLFALLDSLDTVDRRPRAGRSGAGAFRMSIERSFTVAGRGTVATGIPVSGAVATGEELEVLPSRKRGIIRAVQTYKRNAEHARAGVCAAINLRDLDLADVPRGAVLATCGVFAPADALVMTVTNVSERPLKRITEIKFHAGTGSVAGSLRLVGSEGLAPGADGFADVRLAEPVTVAPGDRYVARSPSPPDTIAGGAILGRAARRVKRTSPELLARLEQARGALDSGEGLLAAFLAGPDPIVTKRDLPHLAQAPEPEATVRVSDLVSRGEMVDLGGEGWLVAARAPEVAQVVRNALARYHESHKYAIGMTPSAVAALAGLGENAFKPLIKSLRAADAGIAVKSGRLALAEFEPALSAAQIQIHERVLESVKAAGLGGVARGNLASEAEASGPDMKLILRLLAEEGEIVTAGVYVIAREGLDEARGRLLELFGKGPRVKLNDFRKATGLARNAAVAILERFDSEGMTRRDGDARVLLRSGGAS